MTPQRTAAALWVAVGAITVAGCGGDDDNGVADKSADVILEDAKSAVADIESASISGNMVGDDGTAITLDFQFAESASKGTMSAEGAEFEVLSVDGEFYLKGAADAWDQFAAEGAGDLLADKYVLIPEDQVEGMGEFASFADLTNLVDDILSPDGDISVADETEIDGQKVIGLTSENGGTLYVATTGDPVPVQMKAPEGEEGAIDFEWNIDVDISAPSEDEVVDISTLG